MMGIVEVRENKIWCLWVVGQGMRWGAVGEDGEDDRNPLYMNGQLRG